MRRRFAICSFFVFVGRLTCWGVGVFGHLSFRWHGTFLGECVDVDIWMGCDGVVVFVVPCVGVDVSVNLCLD